MNLENLGRELQDVSDILMSEILSTALAAQRIQEGYTGLSHVMEGASFGGIAHERTAEIEGLLGKILSEQTGLGVDLSRYAGAIGTPVDRSKFAGDVSWQLPQLRPFMTPEDPQPSLAQPEMQPVLESPKEGRKNWLKRRRNSPAAGLPASVFSDVNLSITEAQPEPTPSESYAGDDTKTKKVAALPGGLEHMLDRVKDLSTGKRNGDHTDLMAATAAGSILSSRPVDYDQNRAAYAATLQETRAEGTGAATLVQHVDELRTEGAAPPLDLLVLAADVINDNDNSVLSEEVPVNQQPINQMIANLRDTVESHYNLTTNDEAVVGFLTECMVREQMGPVSPEIQAGLDARLARAWGRIDNKEGNAEVSHIYHKILGVPVAPRTPDELQGM